jgi:hypothetical protein
MYKFLSYDFIKAYKDQWNKNEKLKNDLKNFSAKLKYYIISKEGEAVELVVKKWRSGKLWSGRRQRL